MTTHRFAPLVLALGLAFAGMAYAENASTPVRQSTAAPNVRVLAPMNMPGLDRERVVRIYLPPGYESSQKRYPVIYMHDGQNLFDAATGYAGEWEVDETLNRLATSRGLELIVVGIDNGAAKRMVELNPWDNEQFGKAEGRQYMDFIVDVVKPFIDTQYRTLSDRANTAIMGSSMGGLISHYAMYSYPQVFGKVGIFSPAYWVAPPVSQFTVSHTLPADTKIYFYAGGNEDEHMVVNMRRAVAQVRTTGVAKAGVTMNIAPEAHHNEAAWRVEFPRAIQWLFGGTN